MLDWAPGWLNELVFMCGFFTLLGGLVYVAVRAWRWLDRASQPRRCPECSGAVARREDGMWWCDPCARRDEVEDARLERSGRFERHWVVELEGGGFEQLECTFLVCVDGFGLRQLRNPRRFLSEGSVYDVAEEHVIWRSRLTDIAHDVEDHLDEEDHDDEDAEPLQEVRILIKDLSR